MLVVCHHCSFVCLDSGVALLFSLRARIRVLDTGSVPDAHSAPRDEGAGSWYEGFSSVGRVAKLLSCICMSG